MDELLRGVLGFKGERGYSAYEIAVQNGFEGSESDWLASIGQSSHYTVTKRIYVSEANQIQFNLPNAYDDNSYLDVYVDGLRLTANEYTINTTTNKIVMTNALSEGAEVEIVIQIMATNNLPIVSTINSTSLHTTAASAKAVYDKLIDMIKVIYPIGTVISNITNDNPNDTLINTLWEFLGSETKFNTTLYYYKRVS